MGKAFIQESTLEDLADAIRARNGKDNETYLPSEMAAAIGNIPQNPALDIIEDGVNFYDYDGTLLYCYSWEEVMAQDNNNNYTWQLPPLPCRSSEHLVCDGWNNTAATIRDYYSKFGRWHLSVGCTYHTDDNVTYIWLDVIEGQSTTRSLRIKSTVANAVQIDWGDGSSADTIDSTSATTITHVYPEPHLRDTYLVQIRCTSGTYTTSGRLCSGSDNTANSASRITKILFSNKLTAIGQYVFAGLSKLEKISLPSLLSGSVSCVFLGCASLKHITCPPNWRYIDQSFYNCSSLRTISYNIGYDNPNLHWQYANSRLQYINARYGSVQAYAFFGTKIKRYKVCKNPDDNSAISLLTNSFKNCTELYHLDLGEYIASIDSSAIEGCTSLIELTIPEKVTSIGGSALAGNTSLKRLYMKPEVPPTITATTLNNLPSDCKIYVPYLYYSDYAVANEWSNYVNQLYKYDFENNQEV